MNISYNFFLFMFFGLNASWLNPQTITKTAINQSARTSNQSTQTTVLQAFEISIDGKHITMEPDKPEDGLVVSSSFVKSPGNFGISAFNKPNDFSFSLMCSLRTFKPGTYEVFQCLNQIDCSSTQWASLIPYPSGKILTIKEMKLAYKYPKLGLKPLTLIITSVEKAIWPGTATGTIKRVKGSFSGGIAAVEQYKNNNYYLVGNIKLVKGKFDLFCQTL